MKKGKKLKVKKLLKEKSPPKEENDLREEFDFGAFPKNASLTKNIGCGG